MRPYHFTTGIKQNFKKYYELILNSGGIICFDFEDSLGCAVDSDTDIVKNTFRKELLSELNMLLHDVSFSNLGFRINIPGSEQFEYDMESLNNIQAIGCIFIPKVESSRMIRSATHHISTNVSEIIPIIESNTAFTNLEDILSFEDPRFKNVAYGHCDHNFSFGRFPFIHQDSEAYWNHFAYLDENCRRSGKGLINSPLLELDNTALFLHSLSKCRQYSSYKGQITLCMNQTKLCYTFNNDYDRNCSFDSVPSKMLSAKELVESFNKFRIPGKSFSVDDQRRIISPQEHKSALRLISEL